MLSAQPITQDRHKLAVPAYSPIVSSLPSAQKQEEGYPWEGVHT